MRDRAKNWRYVLAFSAAIALSACGGSDSSGGGGSSGGGTGSSGGGGSTTTAPVPQSTLAAIAAPGQAPTTSISGALRSAVDQAELAYDDLFPLSAQLDGKEQYEPRFGDYLSDGWYAQYRAIAENNLATLAGIERSALTPTEKIIYDAFVYQEQRRLSVFAPEVLKFERGLPMNHITGIQAFYPTYASGLGPIPFETLEDYDNNIPRTREFAAALDATIEAFRTGAANSVFESRNTIDIVIAQLDALLDDSTQQSPFYRPVTVFPAAIGGADQTRLTAAYRSLVEDDVMPALRRLRTYLADEYRAQARSGVGLSNLAGGREYYDFLIEYNTSLDLTADAIHETGLAEVARINNRMTAIKNARGFTGTLDAFDQSLQSNSALGVSSREAYLSLYQTIQSVVDPRMGHFFAYGPRTSLQIQPYDAVREQFMGAASYTPGAPGLRPGVFNFNASFTGGHKLSTTSIYLHEGSPGHHFQIMLAREDAGLPDFLHSGLISYVEGWALYAETIGYDMGLYDDQLIEYGHLIQELLRAMRLVLDTGIHDKGWSRQQAIGYVTANSPFGGLTGEIDRYIGWPSQALGYKLGALEIQRLRARAEQQLGADFDIRRFHHQILGTGALPLPLLEAKIDAWIANGGN